jgi:small subunit ribosomal protein S35
MLEVRHVVRVMREKGNFQSLRYLSSMLSPNPQPAEQAEEFRTIDLVKSKDTRQAPRKRWERKPVPPPRYKKMPVDQDWPSVWPVARSFHPASVPLPLFQGYVPPGQAPPGKFGNLELMKIPNFLHLTPPAINRHCEALKKFCTPWPDGLETDENIEEHFPIEIISSDYLHSTPSIRDHRARIVTLRVKLSSLGLDEYAKDKFLRLVAERYDKTTDWVTIVCDCCPLKKQNFDHAMYLITALVHESWNRQSWESEKVEEDMEKYIWEGSLSHQSVTKLVASVLGNPEVKSPECMEVLKGSIVSTENIGVVEPVQRYRNSTLKIHNRGEDKEVLEEYGRSVRDLFNLPQPK